MVVGWARRSPKSTRRGGSRALGGACYAPPACSRLTGSPAVTAECPFNAAIVFFVEAQNGATVQRHLALLRDAPASPSSRAMTATASSAARSADRVRLSPRQNICRRASQPAVRVAWCLPGEPAGRLRASVNALVMPLHTTNSEAITALPACYIRGRCRAPPATSRW